MCYTGGPYCYTDAKKSYDQAKADYDEDSSSVNRAKLEDAKKKMLMTPEVISKIAEKNPTEGRKLQSQYDKLAESGKVYSSVIKENNEGIKEINSEMEKVQRVMGNPSVSSEDKEKLQTRYKQLESQKQTFKESNKTNLARRKTGQGLEFSHLMPSQFAGYFASTEKKHFNKSEPGSTFTSAKNLNEVLSQAQQQRGSLKGDDREKLIKEHGADPSSFEEGKRYIAVKTEGLLGSVDSSQLDDNQRVVVHQKAEGTKPVLVAEVNSSPKSTVATIVLVDNPTLKGTEGHRNLLITAFPGVSGAKSSNPALEGKVGQSMTVKEAKTLFGGEPFSVNTVVKK